MNVERAFKPLPAHTPLTGSRKVSGPVVWVAQVWETGKERLRTRERVESMVEAAGR